MPLPVRVYLKGPIWCKHVEQLRQRYFSVEDAEPGDTTSIAVPAGISETARHKETRVEMVKKLRIADPGPTVKPMRTNSRMPTGTEYSRDKPRRSGRLKKQ